MALKVQINRVQVERRLILPLSLECIQCLRQPHLYKKIPNKIVHHFWSVSNSWCRQPLLSLLKLVKIAKCKDGQDGQHRRVWPFEQVKNLLEQVHLVLLHLLYERLSPILHPDHPLLIALHPKEYHCSGSPSRRQVKGVPL